MEKRLSADAKQITTALQHTGDDLPLVENFEEWLNSEGLTKVGTVAKRLLRQVWNWASSVKSKYSSKNVTNYQAWQFLLDNPKKFNAKEIQMIWDGLSIQDMIDARNKRLGLSETLKDFNSVNVNNKFFGNKDENFSPLKEKRGDDAYMDTRNKRIMNDPKFYGNLDLHKTFTIPGAYTKKTVVNGTLATPKIVAHRLAENPNPDTSALTDRLNQKFTLIKAVRGLSKVDYDVLDIANYERLAKLALLEYYVVKKVVQAAKTYNLVQTNIGDNIIDSLGFTPSEVRTNLASYETLLCQIHRFISNNLPSSGTWRDRLEYLVSVNIPDYEDQKVATVHMYSICMNNVFYDRDNPSATLTFDCIPHAQNNNYSVMMSNFNQLQAVLVNNTLWQQLIADYFGAFGAKAMWSDKDYPAYAQPLNLRNGDRDLNREQLKNAFYLNTKFEFITINPGVDNKKIELDTDNATANQFPNYQFGQTFDAAAEAGAAQVNYLSLLSSDVYLTLTTTYIQPGMDFGSSNYFLIPDKNGIGAQVVKPVDTVKSYITMTNHETIYTLHKDNYSEEECLDISQFKNRSIGGGITFDSSIDRIEAYINYKTQEYALLDSTVYTFGSNGSAIVEQRYKICDEVVSDDDLQDNESAIDFPDEIMCWALVDWMPFAHFTFFGYVSNDQDYYPRDALLIDMDAFGSLDDRAFATSVNYSIYSLQGAALMVDKNSKRVSNLGDVYKDKPSKRG